MADRTTRRAALVRRPNGMPDLACFRIDERPVTEPGEGEVLVQVDHLSIDPFIRTSLDESSFHPPTPIDGTLSALGVGRVLESRAPELEAGDAVFGPLGAQELVCLPGMMLQKVDEKRAPLTAYLGILGLTTGLTAYFGIRNVGFVKPGETVVVSGAAGAVGSVAGQIAKIEGGRVIGIAGGPHKVRHVVDDLGFDACVDYKGEDTAARLRELAPDGIDVYFDNVGGEILDVALDQIRTRGRVVICGAISQYQNMDDVKGPSLYLRLAERHARMEGYAVTHFAEHYAEAFEQLAGWMAEGRLKLREHVEPGIENFPKALLTLFDGGHTGKLLVKI
ncbi:MAG: NADP-dependent oxidoreductase [Proteobacteria bacterium]|nr:NADP-dependent oxidoreductase [Pseudomonadota bacterium]